MSSSESTTEETCSIAKFSHQGIQLDLWALTGASDGGAGGNSSGSRGRGGGTWRGGWCCRLRFDCGLGTPCERCS